MTEIQDIVQLYTLKDGRKLIKVSYDELWHVVTFLPKRVRFDRVRVEEWPALYRQRVRVESPVKA
jgi:IS4 transposase